jgi:protein gp37
MGENTKIEWAHHTFNPWVGCTKVSFACDNCYAEGWAKRTGQGDLWQGSRRRTAESNWRQPLKWNRQAEAEGVRHRVFCASLADVFDNQVPADWRADLWALIRDTPKLEWLLLTKRPQNIVKMVKAIGFMPANVAFGTTIENRKAVEQRLGHLIVAAGLRPRFLFTSCEPLLGDLGDLSPWMKGNPYPQQLGPGEQWKDGFRIGADGTAQIPGIAWWISGGESGPHARPMHPVWERSVRDQCSRYGAAFLKKQWGEFLPDDQLSPALPYGSMLGKHPSGWFADQMAYWRVGKHAAGRLLDGVEHNGFPEVPA